MTSDSVWAIVRYLLVAGFTWLGQKGYTSSETATTVIGAIGTIFTFGWGVFVKWNTKAVPVETAARVDVPTVNPVTGAKETGPTFSG